MNEFVGSLTKWYLPGYAKLSKLDGLTLAILNRTAMQEVFTKPKADKKIIKFYKKKHVTLLGLTKQKLIKAGYNLKLIEYKFIRSDAL